jgi:thiamine kinase
VPHSLAPTLAQKLEQTLNQWRHWRCDSPLPGKPQVVSVLPGGESNTSILVDAGARYVVRIDGINPASLGLSRQCEQRAQHAASSIGLAPAVRYFNPEVGSLVSDYVASQDWPANPAGELATLLRGIHQLPPLHHRLDMRERLLRYEKQLQHRTGELPRAIIEQRLAVARIMDAVESRPQPKVLCHNDLLPANCLYTGGAFQAIDWEYCAMGNPWFELAVVTTGSDMNADATRQLLTHYLQSPPDDAHYREINDQTCILRYLELLWYLCVKRQQPAEEIIDRLLPGLIATLSGRD